MADNIVDDGNMCRFCLCRDDLIPFSEATSSALTFDDVLYYTGIELSADEEFVLCNDCCVSINESANYRRTCLRNDTIFERLIRLRNGCTTTNPTFTRAPAEGTSVQGAQLKAITLDENDTITLDHSESDVESSLSQTAQQSPMSVFNEEMKTGKTNTDEETVGKAFDESDNESDYSVPSLYGEVMEDALKEKKRKKNMQSSTRTVKKSVYTCPHCPKKFRSENCLQKHLSKGHDTRPIILTCDECGKGFVNEKGYAIHMHTVHRPRQYECQSCYKKLSSVIAYKKHIIEHSPFATKCEDCGKLLRNMLSLGLHKKKGFCKKQTSNTK